MAEEVTFRLEDWIVVTKGDELAKDSEMNLSAPEHTMYHTHLDKHLAEHSDWDVAVDLEAEAEISVYGDGRIAYAEAEEEIHEDILVHGAVLEVGQDITSQLISYMEDNAEILEDKGEHLRVSTPPRLRALHGPKKGAIPVEDTSTVGIQTSDHHVGERYEGDPPQPALDVGNFVLNSYLEITKSVDANSYFGEQEDVTGDYRVQVPDLPD